MFILLQHMLLIEMGGVFMYKTAEQRITKLEWVIEKQAFHIKLLQQILVDPLKLKLNNAIINADLDEATFHKLRQITKDYELRLEQMLPISFGEFLRDFEKIIAKNSSTHHKADLASLVPLWLGGSSDCPGFSKSLHEFFYN